MVPNFRRIHQHPVYMERLAVFLELFLRHDTLQNVSLGYRGRPIISWLETALPQYLHTSAHCNLVGSQLFTLNPLERAPRDLRLPSLYQCITMMYLRLSG